MRPTRRFFILATVVLVGLFVAEAFAFVSVRNENGDATELAQSPEEPEETPFEGPSTLPVPEETAEDEEDDTVAQTSGQENDNQSAGSSGPGLLPRTGRRLLDFTGLAVLMIAVGALFSIVPPLELYSFDLDR
jgi:hypothetical protein